MSPAMWRAVLHDVMPKTLLLVRACDAAAAPAGQLAGVDGVGALDAAGALGGAGARSAPQPGSGVSEHHSQVRGRRGI
jgi:hypothetical protein